MIVEGYFDGTAVRVLEPLDLKVNQKVFVQIPESCEKTTRIQEKLDAIHSVFGILSESESKLVEKSISDGINFKEIKI